MADIRYTTWKEWGMDTFIVQDYIGYIHDKRKEYDGIPRICQNEKFAGIIIYGKEDLLSVSEFIKLCWAARVSCIRIDFSHLDNNDYNRDFIRNLKEYIDYEIGEVYVDLESYEDSFAYGLDVDMRGRLYE